MVVNGSRSATCIFMIIVSFTRVSNAVVAARLSFDPHHYFFEELLI